MIGQLIETGCRVAPGLSRWYLDHYVSIKRFEKQVRHNLGFPAPPSSVTLLVTYACNFGCYHCESTSHPKAEWGLPFETIARLIRELREMGVKVLIISGGEPLVRPDLFEIMGLANQLGFKVLLCTNGSLVERHQEQLARVQPDCVFTSVDGLEDTNDRFRCHPGAFKQTFRALELFQMMGVRGRMVNTMVHPDNLEELDELGDWIMNSAATTWRIALALPSGRARGQERFCLTDDQIRSVLRFIRGRRARFPVYLSEEVGYIGPWALQVRSKPFSSGDGLSHFAIMPTGDVIGSGVLHDPTYSEGNVKERTLKDIWQHGFQQYRQPVLPQDCYTCRHLHACGGGTFGMRVGNRHCLKRLWEGGEDA
ncbi:Fe-S oxidoreductase [Candidatus Methylomirabilis lanthanidiphila]|uniref:Fe-S oxidoreductase n=1 Tax=Candidatus Methylomirabilis lanthanidiphila TaxID=2211376 RepID=A0A564ZJN9_9BACT|nr:radical SAM protein [Candidatus Methylomirabilis lanthanidiphila]VUZ85514.1 Fe-S oxidoreductase [Candidatus Methylomirabilis lanthanidiphila]